MATAAIRKTTASEHCTMGGNGYNFACNFNGRSTCWAIDITQSDGSTLNDYTRTKWMAEALAEFINTTDWDGVGCYEMGTVQMLHDRGEYDKADKFKLVG